MEKEENEGLVSMKRHDSLLHFQIWANFQFHDASDSRNGWVPWIKVYDTTYAYILLYTWCDSTSSIYY